LLLFQYLVAQVIHLPVFFELGHVGFQLRHFGPQLWHQLAQLLAFIVLR
jgi:hypothetical protein